MGMQDTGNDKLSPEIFTMTTVASRGGARNFHWGGGPGTKPCMGPVDEARAVCRHCLETLTAETIKI